MRLEGVLQTLVKDLLLWSRPWARCWGTSALLFPESSGPQGDGQDAERETGERLKMQ